MILFKKCPCCNSRIFVGADSVCKCIENYKCYYCPKCKNQITKSRKVKKDNDFLGILSGIVVIFAINTMSSEKNLFSNLLWTILIILIGSVLWGLLLDLLRKMECIKDDCEEEIERDNSDLWGSNMPFQKMDSIEKENYHKQIDFAVGLGGYGVLIFIILVVIIFLVKYTFG